MSGARFSVAELAHHAEMTPRNVRLYQTRGLLERPQIEGREAVYTDAHLERLQLIRQLQTQGMSLDLIQRLLDGQAQPAARPLLELATRLHRDDRRSARPTITAVELIERFGPHPEAFETAVRRGVLAPRADGDFDVVSPDLLALAERGVELGVSLTSVLEIWDYVAAHAEQAAAYYVDIIQRELWKPFEQRERTDAEWQQILATFDRAREVAGDTYRVHIDRAIRSATDRSIEAQLEQAGGTS